MINIEDINDPRLTIYTNTSEHNLSHIYEPELGLFMAESLKVLERALAAGYVPISALVEDKIASEVLALLEDFPEVEIYTAPFDVLTKLTGYHMTGGVLCAMRRKPLPSLNELCKDARRIAILEDVVNPTNVGAIFRNAAALGIEALILSPGCCDPLYKRAIRVSMGTVFQIPWTIIDAKADDWTSHGLNFIKDMGFAIASMALDDKAISIKNASLRSEEKLAIMLGSEGNGLTDSALALSDYTVMIPMSHGVDSLNVAAASALAFWELGQITP